MTREQIEQLWADPENHRWGIYYCKADPRVIVPKRLKWMGWTVNFARPSAVPVLLGFVALAVAPVWIVAAHGASLGTMLVTLAAVLAVDLPALRLFVGPHGMKVTARGTPCRPSRPLAVASSHSAAAWTASRTARSRAV